MKLSDGATYGIIVVIIIAGVGGSLVVATSGQSQIQMGGDGTADSQSENSTATASLPPLSNPPGASADGLNASLVSERHQSLSYAEQQSGLRFAVSERETDSNEFAPMLNHTGTINGVEESTNYVGDRYSYETYTDGEQRLVRFNNPVAVEYSTHPVRDLQKLDYHHIDYKTVISGHDYTRVGQTRFNGEPVIVYRGEMSDARELMPIYANQPPINSTSTLRISEEGLIHSMSISGNYTIRGIKYRYEGNITVEPTGEAVQEPNWTDTARSEGLSMSGTQLHDGTVLKLTVGGNSTVPANTELRLQSGNPLGAVTTGTRLNSGDTIYVYRGSSQTTDSPLDYSLEDPGPQSTDLGIGGRLRGEMVLEGYDTMFYNGQIQLN